MATPTTMVSLCFATCAVISLRSATVFAAPVASKAATAAPVKATVAAAPTPAPTATPNISSPDSSENKSVYFAGVRKLSWRECIRLAIDNNAEYRAAQAKRNAVFELEGVARAGYLPTISAGASATRMQTDAGGGGSVLSSPTLFDVNLTASENLFNGLGDQARLRLARANTAAADADLRTAKAKLSFDLKAGYENLLSSKAFIDLQQAIVAQREYNMRMVKLRFEGGQENKGSVLQSEAYLEEARLNLVQAHYAYRTSQAQLRKLLGIEEVVNFDISDSVPTSDVEYHDLDFKSILLTTPAHEQAQAVEESAQHNVTANRSAFYPTLGLVGATGQGGDTFLPGGDRRWSVALNLSIPLFNGGKDYYNVRSASENYLNQARLRNSIDQALQVSLQDAYFGYASSIKRLKIDKSFQEALQVRAKIGRAKYKQGLLTFDDWDRIENDLIDRENKFLSSSRDRVTAEAAWEQAQGKGVIP